MRLVVLLAGLVLTAGCSGSKWKPCEHLEITTRNSAGKPQWLRYENARYRVLDTDPLTVEWEHTGCGLKRAPWRRFAGGSRRPGRWIASRAGKPAASDEPEL